VTEEGSSSIDKQSGVVSDKKRTRDEKVRKERDGMTREERGEGGETITAEGDMEKH